MRLDLEGITAGYGPVTVLRDVSVCVPPQTVVALLGSNGAGKTTLLRAASNVLRASSGRIVLDGDDVTDLPAEEISRRGVAHITEGRSVFPGLTVRENLRLFCERGDEGDGTERAVAAFPILGQRLRQVAGTMSGGEQQMLAVSRAYARGASIVLLDELSTGLAPGVVDEILDFVRKLVADGVSVLLVEQYVAKALDLADLVYVLERGRITYAGEPPELTSGELLARYLGA